MGSDEREVSARRRIHQTGTGSVAFEAAGRDDLFGKSEIRPPKKFLLLSGRSRRKGVGLALGGAFLII